MRSASAHGPPKGPGIRCSGSAPETLIQRVRCTASVHSPLQASETRLSTKEEVRLYHLESVLFFPGTPVDFAGDRNGRQDIHFKDGRG